MAPRKENRRSSSKKQKKGKNNMGGKNQKKIKAKTAAQLKRLEYSEFEDHVFEHTKKAFRSEWEVEKQKEVDQYRLDILMSRGKKTIVIEVKHYKKSDLGSEEEEQVKKYMKAAKANMAAIVVLKDTKVDEGIPEDERIKLVRANYHLRANLKNTLKKE